MTAFNVQIKKEERPQSVIYASTLSQKKKEKYTQSNLQTNTPKTEEKKIEIKSKEKKNHRKKKNWFIEKINKVDKTLAR